MRWPRIGYLIPALLISAGLLEAQSTAPVKSGSYFLKPGDVVRTTIWREPELNGEFLVPETGIIAFPKIGNRNVLDRPAATLRTELITDYQKFLRNPSIEISFLRRVNVLGAVTKPGIYALDETMSVAHALASAGGALPEGKQNEVQLLRGGEKLITNITQRTMLADLPLQSGDQLWVPERSWLERNASLVAGVLSAAVSVAVTLIVNNN